MNRLCRDVLMLGNGAITTLLLVASITGVIALAGCDTKTPGTTPGDSTATTDTGMASNGDMAADPVKRGGYLVTLGGCNDCHTPFKMGANGQPEPDMALMLSGHPGSMPMPPAPKLTMPWAWAGAATLTAFAGPWGVSYAANLTPDSATGIGGWSEADFIQTLKSGQHKGSVARPIMPPMPWMNLAQATESDLKAIYAFLRSIPPIKNQVPAYEPPAGAPGGGAPPMAPSSGGDTSKHDTGATMK